MTQDISFLELDLGCKFNATCVAYIEYKVCIRKDDKEEEKSFKSLDFEVVIAGNKSLLEPLPVELPPELDLQNIG